MAARARLVVAVFTMSWDAVQHVQRCQPRFPGLQDLLSISLLDLAADL